MHFVYSIFVIIKMNSRRENCYIVIRLNYFYDSLLQNLAKIILNV